jgi:hypothetical protein
MKPRWRYVGKQHCLWQFQTSKHRYEISEERGHKYQIARFVVGSTSGYARYALHGRDNYESYPTLEAAMTIVHNDAAAAVAKRRGERVPPNQPVRLVLVR